MKQIIDANNHFRRVLEIEGESSILRKILNEYSVATDSPLIVWDGPNSLKARREIFPDYKAKRNKPKDDIYINFDMIRAVLEYCPVVQLRVPNYEADDVIAAIYQEGDRIVSTDRDFLQLPGAGVLSTPYEGVPNHLIRTYKTMVGDPADCIPGIKQFGKKTWHEVGGENAHNWLMALLNDEELPDIGIPSRCKYEPEDLKVYWQIVGFIPVPLEDLSKHMTVGRPNYEAADAFLREFMQ